MSWPISRRTFLAVLAHRAWLGLPLLLAQSCRHKQPVEPAPSRKERVLTKARPAAAASLADAVVMKEQDIFLVTQADGQIPIGNGHGLGLYYHDCRYLNGYELRLGRLVPHGLGGTAEAGYTATLQLANPEMQMMNGTVLAQEEIAVDWHRLLHGGTPALHDQLFFHNYSGRPVDFTVSLTFEASFEDVFVVRGLLSDPTGRREPPGWRDEILGFVYAGTDHLYRSVSIQFDPVPHAVNGTTVEFHIQLPPRGVQRLHLDVVLSESSDRRQVEPQVHRRPNLVDHQSKLEADAERWLKSIARVSTDNLVLQRALDRSFRDLLMLRSRIRGDEFFSAGIPWFATLFGRDSLITSLQTLAYDPDIAAQTLRLLAQYQGTRLDAWRDEEPGKILHELRIGEAARLGLVPHTPYYGSVDATLLFLILVGQHAVWTGELFLFKELRDHIEHALEWMDVYGDAHGTQYVAYRSASSQGLVNQGWKDSGNAIVNQDGSAVTAPVALVEVQGYAYRAKLSMAALFHRAGDQERAARLRTEAERLREPFNRDFWMPERQCYALALQSGGRQAAVIASNAGQALWAGIADDELSGAVADRLMAREMFTGWGIRTLSAGEQAYNPLGYHVGTVWPHDNSLIVAGLRRYGFDGPALEVFSGMTQASQYFKDSQLPELFGGFDRSTFHRPIAYPVACHPQAWAAGALPYMLQSLLGLTPNAFEHRLEIVRPRLPAFVETVEVRQLRVGQAICSVKFERKAQGFVHVDILDTQGPLEIHRRE